MALSRVEQIDPLDWKWIKSHWQECFPKLVSQMTPEELDASAKETAESGSDLMKTCVSQGLAHDQAMEFVWEMVNYPLGRNYTEEEEDKPWP